MKKLGKADKTERGFAIVEFKDQYDVPCSLQASSVVLSEHGLDNPGTSAVWLGITTVKPIVMARDAARLGVQTREENGWVRYPIPEGVQLNSRMHLDRDQVAGLILRLQEWLDKGTWKG